MPPEPKLLLSDSVIAELREFGINVVKKKFRFDHATAEDVVQVALLKAWCGVPSFRQTCNITTWFYRIVANEALMHIRRNKKDSVLSPILDVILSDGNHHQEKILNRIEKRTELEVIEQAINHLSFHERLCFEKYFLEDMSYKEISDETGKKVGSVKANIHRGKQKVREECLVLA